MHHCMKYSLILITSVVLSSTLAAEEAPVMDQPKRDNPGSSLSKSDQAGWQLSIIAGGLSKHLTTKYEPAKGYTETHSNLGLEIGQAGPGWVVSAQATWFKDSHDENSFMGIGAYGYKASLPYHFFIYGGIGAGYVDTSYYAGAVVMPFVELGWWRISAQGSYLPELSDMDSGLAVQFKVKLLDW